MPTKLQKIKAKMGPGSSRRGLCNSPHPDPKWTEPKQVPHPEGKVVRIGNRLEPVMVEAMVPTVTCSRFALHEGDCAAYTFSVKVPDRWTKPEGWDDQYA